MIIVRDNTVKVIKISDRSLKRANKIEKLFPSHCYVDYVDHWDSFALIIYKCGLPWLP